MRIILINTLILFVFIACSSSEKTSTADLNKNQNKRNYTDSLSNSNRAQELFINGSTYELKGNYAEAILEFQSALEHHESAGIHYALGKNYLRINKLAPALKHGKRASELDSRNTDYLFLLANIYTAARQNDSAALTYERIIGIDPDNHQAYYNLAYIYEPTKPQAALSVYKKLIDKIGPEWNVLIRIADINERLGNVDETISTVSAMMEIDPSNIQLKKLLIESYIKTERYDEAMALTEDAIITFPDDLNLIEYKGAILIKKKKITEGTEEYKKLITNEEFPFESKKRIVTGFFSESSSDSSLLPIAKLLLTELKHDSTDWQLEAFLGEIALIENEDSLAVEYFKNAVQLAEWNSQLWNRLGIIAFENQRYDEALVQMEEAVKKFPDDFVINIILGLTLSQKNKHEEAEPVLRKAVSINPSDLTALHAYGFTLNQLKKSREALIYLEKALSQSPENVPIMGTIGLIYDSLKEWDKCDEVYKKALEIEHDNALILNNYAYSLAERSIELEFALSMAEKAISTEPENSSYLDTIGWIFYKLGNYEQAKFYIEKAFEKERENSTLADHLGDIYLKLGERERAAQFYKKALELNESLDETKQKLLQVNP